MEFHDDPLRAALATAFADSPIPQQNVESSAPKPSSSATQQEPSAESPAVSSEATVEDDESWKGDYEKLVAGWRAESAIARRKAEQERERWSLIREKEEAEEKEHAARVGSDSKRSQQRTGWETGARGPGALESDPKPTQRDEDGGRGDSKLARRQEHSETSGRRLSIAKQAAEDVRDSPPRRGSPSPADVRDLVSGETPRGRGEPPESLLPHANPTSSGNAADHQDYLHDLSIPATAESSNPESRTWEEIPSLESSFPSSLSFPERSGAPSPEPRPPQTSRSQPTSVTLAIFDSSLSKRARVLALVSSLAINLFLPFVNGVMLGFGEIFARNIVSALGWNVPGGVGIRARPKQARS